MIHQLVLVVNFKKEYQELLLLLLWVNCNNLMFSKGIYKGFFIRLFCGIDSCSSGLANEVGKLLF
jgi:hypothetical protein